MVHNVKHKHHIVPKYEGGSDDPSNLVELSVTQHAMWHFAEWQRKGLWQDKVAWLGLTGICTHEETVQLALVEQGKWLGEYAHKEKSENGKSILGLRNAERLHSEKDDEGKSVQARKAGRRRAQATNSVTDEKGLKVLPSRGGKIGGPKGARTTNSLLFQDPDHPELGAHHVQTLKKLQRSNGYPSGKDNRVKLTSP